MQEWQKDFTYYYFDQHGNISTAFKVSEIPDSVSNYANTGDAVSHFQKRGCIGKSLHISDSEYYDLCLYILKKATEKYGQEVSVLREIRDNYPESAHKILFGTFDKEVAEFYGETIKTYTVKGLIINSLKHSVKEF